MLDLVLAFLVFALVKFYIDTTYTSDMSKATLLATFIDDIIVPAVYYFLEVGTMLLTKLNEAGVIDKVKGKAELLYTMVSKGTLHPETVLVQDYLAKLAEMEKELGLMDEVVEELTEEPVKDEVE